MVSSIEVWDRIATYVLTGAVGTYWHAALPPPLEWRAGLLATLIIAVEALHYRASIHRCHSREFPAQKSAPLAQPLPRLPSIRKR